MGLFAGLIQTADRRSSRRGTSKSLDLPTVIQLYTDPAALWTWEMALSVPSAPSSSTTTTSTTGTTTTSSTTYARPSYAPLAFQAVQVGLLGRSSFDADGEGSARGGGGGRLASPAATPAVVVPDLGIWTCRVTASTPPATTTSSTNGPPLDAHSPSSSSSSGGGPWWLAELLLPLTMATTASTRGYFCFTVDLTDLSQVEPSLTLQQQALVRFLIGQANHHHHDSGPLTESTPAASSQQDAATATVSSFETTTASVATTNTTTTLHQLQTVSLGAAPSAAPSTTTTTTTSSSSSSSSSSDPELPPVHIALMICAKMPRSTAQPGPETETADDYRQHQAQALIYYHLRRFAAALQATLVFVREDLATTTEAISTTFGSIPPPASSTLTSSAWAGLQQSQPTLTMPQLGLVWREWALGRPVWKETTALLAAAEESSAWAGAAEPAAADPATDDAEGKNTVPTEESAFSLVYGPGSHQEELIESALLRHATYPGHWDAAQDPLWKILPPPPATTPTPTTTPTVDRRPAGGDDAWLAELRDSVANLLVTTTGGGSSETLTSPPPKKSDAAAAAATHTPKDAAVSSFFENLLKKP